MIKFALCDDNRQLLIKLQELLETIFTKNNLDASIILSTTDSKKLVNFVAQNEVNVLFLDIDLRSASNGIDIAKQIRKDNKSIYIVFLTAHFEYIVSAFECKTFDFIHKPFSLSKLENTVLRLFDDMFANTQTFLKLNNSRKLINQDLINYIQKDGMKTIYSLNSDIVESYGSFTKLSETLPGNFVRCHKSFIVNINNISNIDLSNNTIFFKGLTSSKCFIGPKYKNNFMEVLKTNGNVKQFMANPN